MELVLFEENKPLVLAGLEQGEFDYIDAAGEVFETEFFRYITTKKILQSLAETYPTPRKKEEVPLWFYIASNLSMRLHGEHSFHAFPMIVRVGGMLNAFGPETGRKKRSSIRRPRTSRLPVRGLTRRITMIVKRPAIRIRCANWPRTQTPRR